MSSPKWWQIACGSAGRDYADYFLKFGMAFVGGQKNIDQMRLVEAGDHMILKRGTSSILAVGLVTEAWNEDEAKHWLRDVDGWDLRANCRVKWHEVDENGGRTVTGLTRSTLQRVHQQELINVARELMENNSVDKDRRETDVAEPKPTEKIGEEELLSFLVREGLRPGSASELSRALQRIRLLADYYYSDPGFRWDDVREHETRSFLIVPLMLALGWSEQQIKIELPAGGQKRADMAFFARPYRRDPDDCVLILESKGFSQGLTYARDQAENYANNFINCRTIVVSNGYCYKAFERDRETQEFPTEPTAYLNVRDPRRNYPLDPQRGGALETLKLLLPGTYLTT